MPPKVFGTDVLYNWTSCTNVWRRNSFSKQFWHIWPRWPWPLT